MADLVLFNVTNRILRKLVSLDAAEEIGVRDVKDELGHIKNGVLKIRNVLVDAEKKQSEDMRVKDWLEKVKQLVDEVDVWLEDNWTEVLRRRVMDGNRMTKEVRAFFSHSNQFVYGRKMARKIKKIRSRLDEIVYAAEKEFHFDVRIIEHEIQNEVREETNSSPPDDPEVVIPREPEKKKIIGQLMSPTYPGYVSVIEIIGEEGIGKTTLAKAVFNDEQVNSHFKLKFWVSLSGSDQFHEKLIVKMMLDSANYRKQKELKPETLKQHLARYVSGKRVLLVFDDFQLGLGHDIRRYLEILYGAAEGSQIMILSNYSWSTSRLYFIKGLSPSESWSLFIQIVLKGQQPKNPQVVENGEEIVETYCQGNPLLIKTIGSLLRFKDPETQWLPLLRNELSKLDHTSNNNYSSKVLRLSYDHLPSHLKQCFAYCSLFPKDYKIEVPKLIQLWIAQGFVTSSVSSQSLEDVVLGYFKDLQSRCFFQEVEKDEEGDIITCKMHGLMHDLATSVAGGETAILYETAQSLFGWNNPRHVSVEFNNSPAWKILTSSPQPRGLQSFLSLSRLWNVSVDEGEIDEIFRNMRSLWSLDLSGMKMKIIPSSIGGLNHLRYLNISGNPFEVLPTSITRLHNLEILNLSDCSNLKELPRDIKKLISLKHLDCKDCMRLMHMPRGIGQLTSLEKLTTFKVGLVSKYVGGLNELNRLNNLRGHLGIQILGNVKNGASEFEAANLKEKKHLQSLELSWYERVDDKDYSEDAEMLLQSLHPHPNLKTLWIQGYGGLKFPWLPSLTNLVGIWIHNCGRCQHVGQLDEIPSLRELCLWDLRDLEYVDGKSEGAKRSTFFPSLQKLTLRGCPNLKGWWEKIQNDDNGVMAQFPCLSSLKVWDCPKLTWMPLFPTLDDTLTLKNVNLAPLQQTMKLNTKMINSPLSSLKMLEIKEIKELEFFAEEWFQNLTSLQQLSIVDCPRLTSVDQGISGGRGWLHCLKNLERIVIDNCSRCRHLPQLDQIPSLKELWLCDLYDLEYVDGGDHSNSSVAERGSTFFPSLRKLELSNCPNLEGWWKKKTQLPQFPRLSYLGIRFCPKLTLMPMFPTLDDTLRLENASLEPLQTTMKLKTKMVTSSPSSSSFSPLSELTSLKIYDIEELETLPEWLRGLTSLQRLTIWECPRLEYLPPEILKSMSLEKLSIEQCPKLNKRYGELRISGIRNIKIDGQVISKIDGQWINDKSYSQLK